MEQYLQHIILPKIKNFIKHYPVKNVKKWNIIKAYNNSAYSILILLF